MNIPLPAPAMLGYYYFTEGKFFGGGGGGGAGRCGVTVYPLVDVGFSFDFLLLDSRTEDLGVQDWELVDC